MTIKLTAAAETELVMKIAEGLQNVVVNRDNLFTTDFKWASALQADLPDDARAKLDRYIGERGLATLIIREIERDRHSGTVIEPVPNGQRLTSMPLLSNPIEYARRIVSKLKILPIRYRVTIPLSTFFCAPIYMAAEEVIKLPQNIIIAKSGSLPDPLPISSPIPYYDRMLFNDWMRGGKEDREIESERLYLSLPMLGYANPGQGTTVARNAEDFMRAFYGAGIAIGMLAFGWEGADDKRSYIMIHHEETRELYDTERIEDELRASYYQTSTKAFSEKHARELPDAIGRAIRRIGTIFQGDVDSNRLFSACIWFQKAKVNNRPLDAVLQATIAIEVLLGDRKAAEGVGLTNLLSSRCAYLLGRSTNHRQKIEGDFRKVYELRSQIVHEGRHVTKIEDRPTLNLALELCANIITRELAIRAAEPKP